MINLDQTWFPVWCPKCVAPWPETLGIRQTHWEPQEYELMGLLCPNGCDADPIWPMGDDCSPCSRLRRWSARAVAIGIERLGEPFCCEVELANSG